MSGALTSSLLVIYKNWTIFYVSGKGRSRVAESVVEGLILIPILYTLVSDHHIFLPPEAAVWLDSVYHRVLSVGERLGGGHPKAVDNDFHRNRLYFCCRRRAADDRGQGSAPFRPFRHAVFNTNRVLTNRKVGRKVYVHLGMSAGLSHLWMLHLLLAKKTSLRTPEFRNRPVRFTVVPPNSGPKSGLISVILGSWFKTTEKNIIFHLGVRFNNSTSSCHISGYSHHEGESVAACDAVDGVGPPRLLLMNFQCDVEVLLWTFFQNFTH